MSDALPILNPNCITEPSVGNMPKGLAAEALKLHYEIKAQILVPIVGVIGTPLVMYLVYIIKKDKRSKKHIETVVRKMQVSVEDNSPMCRTL